MYTKEQYINQLVTLIYCAFLTYNILYWGNEHTTNKYEDHNKHIK